MNKTAIITGASKGIGFATAKIFVQNGFNVALCARTEKSLNEAKTALQKVNEKVKVFTKTCDVSKKDDLNSFAQAVLNEFDVIDVLVNNAGVFFPGEVHQEEDGVLEQMIETNVYSAYRMSRAIVPNMKSRKSGYIFNRSSANRIVQATRDVEAMRKNYPHHYRKARGITPTMRYLARIDAVGSSVGYYTATEVMMTSSGIAVRPNGYIWDGQSGNHPEIYEINSDDSLPVGAIVEVAYTAGEVGLWWTNAGGTTAVFPVLVRVDGGAAGDFTTNCNYTYECKPLGGTILASAVTPLRPRMPMVAYAFAANDSIGLAYFDDQGNFNLIEAIEEIPLTATITVQVDTKVDTNTNTVEYKQQDIRVLQVSAVTPQWSIIHQGTVCPP